MKTGLSAVLVTTILSSSAWGLPQDGVVTSGGASINTTGSIMNVNQTTSKATIDWNSFNIGQRETVNFNSANASDITVNRVTGGGPGSVISGMMNSNHNVVLLDNSGITFTKTARVNVGGLVAATTSQYDLNSNQLKLNNIANAKITNDGTITTADGGMVVMVAREVENNGDITANNGEIALGSAKAGNILFSGFKGNRINFEVSPEVVEHSGIENTGTLTAHNGFISLTAKQVGNLGAGVINLGGVVDASSFGLNANGGTVLVDSSGEINSGGYVDVSGTNAPGKIITKAGTTNYFVGTYTAQGSGETFGSNKGLIQISGKDVVFGGDILTESSNSAKLPVADVVLESATGFNIKDIRVPLLANSLYEKDLEAISRNSDISLHGKQITLENLRDNKLDLQNNLRIGSYGYNGPLAGAQKGALTALDKKDTIAAKSISIDMHDSIDVGNLLAKEDVLLSSGSYAYTTNYTKTGDIQSGYLDVRTIGGNITLGDINVAGNDMNPSGTVSLLSRGGNITSGDINIKDAFNSPLNSGELNVSALGSVGFGISPGGDVELGNINIDVTAPQEPTFYTTAAAAIKGNNITIGDADIKANGTDSAYLTDAKLDIRSEGDIKTGNVELLASNVKPGHGGFGMPGKTTTNLLLQSTRKDIDVAGNIAAVSKTDIPQKTVPTSGSSITIDAKIGKVFTGPKITADSVNSAGDANGGYTDIEITSGYIPPMYTPTVITPVNGIVGLNFNLGPIVQNMSPQTIALSNNTSLGNQLSGGLAAINNSNIVLSAPTASQTVSLNGGSVNSALNLGSISKQQPAFPTSDGPQLPTGSGSVNTSITQNQPVVITAPAIVATEELKPAQVNVVQLAPIMNALDDNHRVAVLNSFTARPSSYSLNVNFVGPLQVQ